MALVSTLTDDFAAADTGKWTYGANASVADGRLNAVCLIDYSGETVSVALYDLTGSSARVQTVRTANVGVGNTDSYMGLRDAGGTNAVEFNVNNGSLLANSMVASASTAVNTSTYNPTTHAFLRIREASGTIFWETSSDGSTWSAFTSLATPITITALRVYIGSGHFAAETSPGTAVFDNFNVAPPTRSAVDLASSGTGTVVSTAAAATTVVPDYPALTVGAGQLACYHAYLHVRGAGRTVTTPTGWLPLGSIASTNTSAEGAGTGPTRTWVYRRTSTTALAGTQSFTISAQATSGVAQGYIRGYVAAGTDPAFEEVLLGWSNPTTGTGGGSLAPDGALTVSVGQVAAKDELHVHLGINDDDNTAASVGSITCTGSTVGAASATATRTTTANGNDLTTAGFAATVTAGTNSGTTLTVPVTQAPVNQMHGLVLRVRATATEASAPRRPFLVTQAALTRASTW